MKPGIKEAHAEALEELKAGEITTTTFSYFLIERIDRIEAETAELKQTIYKLAGLIQLIH